MSQTEDTGTVSAAHGLETVRFPVGGMTCTSCVVRITRAIRKLDGVRRVEVDLRRETATVVCEPASVSDAALAAAVVQAGYEADLGSAVSLTTTERPSLLDRLLRRAP